MRWTTGLGIAIGGTSGALAALIGVTKEAPRQLPPAAAAVAVAPSTPSATAPVEPSAAQPVAEPAAATAPTEPAPASTAAVGEAPAVPSAVVQALASGGPALAPPAHLDVPSTRPALLKAMLYCDQKRDFDACATVAVALDTGSAGPAEPEQAKRFRKIALTHLVAQCEAASPRACLVLATKYRAGTELAQNIKGAEALEARAAELCRLRPSADCPAP